MRTTSGPIAARKLIGRQLRRLRDASGERQATAAKVIGRSVDTLQRIERGESSVGRSDIIVLCAAYDAPAEIREQLLLMQDLQRSKSWWEGFAPDADLALTVELESTANVIEQYDHFYVPGILQTEAYAKCVIHAVEPNTTLEGIERQAELRLGRIDRVFSGDDQPHVSLIIEEMALRRHVGSADVMREQLRRLLDPPAGCEVRVIPFEAGAHPGVGSFTVFTFDEAFLSPVAYVDGVARGQVLFDEDDDVHTLQHIYAQLRKLALNQVTSSELIALILQEL
jgi:transcriptional regulator with XRE-family HTH domain